MKRALQPLLAIAVASALAGCAAAPPSEPAQTANPFQGTVTYTLELSETQASTADHGWIVTNDLGVRFVVQRGGFILQNLQLTTCDPLHKGHQHGQWMRWAPIRSAYASHGEPQDPSAIDIPRYISAAGNSASTTTLESAGNGQYCGVHVLLGRLLGSVAQGPAAPETLQGNSLWIEGTWQLPNTETTLPFRVQATEAFGKRIEIFEDIPTHLDHSFHSVTVIGRADRSKWFDGIHPQKMDQRAMRRLVLRNVVESMEWRSQPTGKNASEPTLSK